MKFYSPKSIDQVLEQFDGFIEWSERDQSNLGIFATVYRKSTIRIKHKIQQGDFFEDNNRMEQLVILFADRYFKALEDYRNGVRPTESWHIAFKATEDKNTSILQHLLLGITAHIGLDLGIVCHQTHVGQDLEKFQQDFKRIETLLFEVARDVIEGISKLAIWFKIVRTLLLMDARKSMILTAKVRSIGWRLAERMARHEQKFHHYLIKARDVKTASWLRFLYRPGYLMQFGWSFVKRYEEPRVGIIIQTLA